MYEIDVFLNSLKAKSKSVRKLYTAGLNAWKKFTKGELQAENVTEKDIDRYIFNLEKEQRKELNTIAEYLTPLAVFFRRYNPELRSYVLKKQKELRAYIKTITKSDQTYIFDIAKKMIELATKLQHKLCLWLVTAEGMSNHCVANLRVRDIDFQQHTYMVQLDSGLERRQLHPYTLKMIKRRIDEVSLKLNDRLIGVNQRTMLYWTKKYAKKTDFKQWEDVTLNKLRYIGKTRTLREVFIRECQKAESSEELTKLH